MSFGSGDLYSIDHSKKNPRDVQAANNSQILADQVQGVDIFCGQVLEHSELKMLGQFRPTIRFL